MRSHRIFCTCGFHATSRIAGGPIICRGKTIRVSVEEIEHGALFPARRLAGVRGGEGIARWFGFIQRPVGINVVRVGVIFLRRELRACRKCDPNGTSLRSSALERRR